MSSGGEPYRQLRLTRSFLVSVTSTDFNAAERRAFVKALDLLDRDERHPSLRVHELRGPLAGTWSASASRTLRMTFLRGRDDLKVMLVCSHHYQ